MADELDWRLWIMHEQLDRLKGLICTMIANKTVKRDKFSEGRRIRDTWLMSLASVRGVQPTNKQTPEERKKGQHDKKRDRSILKIIWMFPIK
jgi:hypothetical protein